MTIYFPIYLQLILLGHRLCDSACRLHFPCSPACRQRLARLTQQAHASLIKRIEKSEEEDKRTCLIQNSYITEIGAK